MSLSTAEIEAVVRDLKPKVEGGRIDRIDQPDPHRLILSIRKGTGHYWLLLCAHPRFSRIHLLTLRPEQGKPAAGFCKAVRDHITDAPVTQLWQVPNDRVVVLDCTERDRLMRPHRIRLVAELVGVASNLVLLDETDKVLATLVREQSARRTVVPGSPYVFPTPPGVLPEQALTNRFSAALDVQDPLSLSRAIQSCYRQLEAVEELAWARSELLSVLRAGAKKASRRLDRISAALRACREADAIRRQGELLKIALPDIKEGQTEAVVEDLFEPGRPAVHIPLDSRLSPQENLDRLFARYKKARAGHDRLQARAAEAERDLRRIEKTIETTASAESLEELTKVGDEATKAGLVPLKPVAPKPPQERAGPRVFRSADGHQILVGRNPRENDRLTFTIARGNDYWLHLLGTSGPHVVVRTPPDKGISQESLLDAAHLLVHFSRLRGTDSAEVVYTQCKRLRRMKHAPAGTVSYSKAATLRVRMERERIDRLLRRDQEDDSASV